MRVFFFFSFKLVLTSGLTLFLLHRTGSKLLFGSCSEFFVSDISCFQLEGLNISFFSPDFCATPLLGIVITKHL